MSLQLLIPELSAVNACAAVCGGLRSSTAQEDQREARVSEWPWSLQVLGTCGLRLDLVSFNAWLGATPTWQKALPLLASLQEASLQADRITSSHLRLPWSRSLRIGRIGLKGAITEPSWQLSLAAMTWGEDGCLSDSRGSRQDLQRAVLRACAASTTWSKAGASEIRLAAG